MKERIVFVGGDKRQLYAARKLSARGYEVYVFGFDKLDNSSLLNLDDFYTADVIVLPVTGVRGDVVPTYYSDKEIKLDYKKISGKLIIMGRAQTLSGADCEVYDILKHKDFAEANALPSAEGAVMVAMQSYEGTVAGSRCLVIGYGRIGRALSCMLKALNADVNVASRSVEKARMIKADSNTPVNTNEIMSINGYDIVFNTADALVIDSTILKNSDSRALIIDLASGKGGVDFAAADALGFRAIHALGLPGKYSPKTAGEIISDTVLAILGHKGE